MKTLVIDNYDSYTHLIAYYCHVITQQAPIVIKNNTYDVTYIKRYQPDVIIFSPGPGEPTTCGDVGVCADVLADPDLSETPILGVCLGHQLIASYYGLEVIQAPQPFHGKQSIVEHTQDLLFDGLPDRFPVIRYHSLVVDSFSKRADLMCIATTVEPKPLVMALKHRHLPLYGVQFHPESIGTVDGQQLFYNFFQFAKQLKQRSSLVSGLV